MKTKFLGRVAVALGLGIAGSANAQNGSYPAGGYVAGSQSSTVPVHPSLQQPPNQSQWPVNGASPQRFAPNWAQGQPGFAAQQYGPPPQEFAPNWSQVQPGMAGRQNRSQLQDFSPNAFQGRPAYASQQGQPPQAQLAAQPRFLPQPYHAASTQNATNQDGASATPQMPETELLPEAVAQPDASTQWSNGAGPYGQHNHSQPYPGVPGSQSHPHQYAPSHSEASGPFSTWSGRSFGSIFQDAIEAPWEAGAPMPQGAAGACGPNGCGPAPAPVSYGLVPLRNWFAGANLLFLTTEQSGDRRLVYDAGNKMPTLLSTRDIDPSGDVGFDVFLGRYLHGGRHALMVNYFFFNPSRETVTIEEPAAGVGAMGNPYAYCAPIPSWNNISYDVGMDGDRMNDVTVYDRYADSISFRARRDVSFQGIEANFVSFGLGGAQRAGLGPLAGPCETGCGPRGCAGPMIPGCNSNLHIRTMHGLRWFQFKDAFEFAASHTDYMYGKTNDDMYYNIDTENNLYGYQFGARIDYALSCRINAYAGSKFGIFANDAQFRSRIGTTDMPAYVNDFYPSIDGDAVVTRESDTVLATLGELDLGLGYRVNPCWTLRGGYRLYGMTGVATSVGSIADDLAHLPSAGRVRADDSILLHGGYVGAEYNW